MEVYNLYFYIFKTQTNVYETVCELNSNQNTFENRMRDVEDKLCLLQVILCSGLKVNVYNLLIFNFYFYRPS